MRFIDADNIGMLMSTDMLPVARVDDSSPYHTTLESISHYVISLFAFNPTADTLDHNTIFGVNAFAANVSGSSNTAIGDGAMQANTSGVRNVGIGAKALQDNTGGAYNVMVGYNAGAHTTTDKNVAIGDSALAYNTAGGFNTAVGSGANTGASFYMTTCLGCDAQVTGNSQVQLGGSGTTTYAYGAVQDRSDMRDKADIIETPLGLAFIMALKPVQFRWDMRDDYRPPFPDIYPPAPLGADPSDSEQAIYGHAMEQYNIALAEWQKACDISKITPDGTKKRVRYHQGLIAQQVKETMDELGVDFGGYQNHKINGGADVQSLGYSEFIGPLIKAVQELAARVQELETHFGAS